MKILLCVLLLAVCQAQPTAPDGDMKVIRNSGKGTVIYKFEDGPNTCYVAETEKFYRNYNGSTAVGISCLKR